MKKKIANKLLGGATTISQPLLSDDFEKARDTRLKELYALDEQATDVYNIKTRLFMYTQFSLCCRTEGTFNAVKGALKESLERYFISASALKDLLMIAENDVEAYSDLVKAHMFALKGKDKEAVAKVAENLVNMHPTLKKKLGNK